MPMTDCDAVFMSGVPLATRIAILNRKIEMAKKSVVDYVEPRSGYYFSGGGW